MSGGIGNQMFQYSVGRFLSLKNQTTLKLDISSYNKQPEGIFRKFSLSHFNINADLSSENEKLYILSQKKYIKVLPKIVIRLTKLYYKGNHIKERNLFFDHNILKMNHDLILEGYWPNENYFIQIDKIIREEFTLKSDHINLSFLKWKKEISLNNSVSIHIRRSDYIENSRNFEIFGVCDINYYYRSIQYILKHISNPFFYIFSDDISWVKENFKISIPYLILSDNNIDDYHELLLMSYCKHNIIANSTFSWWAGWLNNNHNKIVIAPNKWYNNASLQRFYEQSNFIPHNWIKL